MLQAAFQEIAFQEMASTSPAAPGVPSLVRLSSRAILPAGGTDAAFGRSMRLVHSLLVRSLDHTIEASLSAWKELWAPLGRHITAWLARVKPQQQEEVAGLEQARRSAIAYITAHVGALTNS